MKNCIKLTSIKLTIGAVRGIGLFVIAFSALGMLSSCATITKGTTDTLQVLVSNCGESMACTATNKKGSWPFKAPGPVTFKKSDNDLTIVCQDGDEVITQTVTPTRGNMAWGNVLLGGVIGGGVDASTDAHWDMVDSISIYRENCLGKPVE